MSPASIDKQTVEVKQVSDLEINSVESHDDTRNDILQDGVHRRLKARHLAMIALGGTIGTGLFVGSGGALAKGGPVGALLAYAIMGFVVYTVMIALGEMTTLLPVSGGFVNYASRFIDPAVGFALGVNYWYCFAIALPVELTAVAMVIEYWTTSVHVAVWITIQFVLILGINFLGVRWYGECEFWFSAIKIVTIVGLIILGIAINCGAGPASTGYIGFRYWADPGPFNQITIHRGAGFISGPWGRFLAFWSVFVQAAFSFVGLEIIAVSAAEAENPQRNVPKAIRRVFWRIMLFYVLGIMVIGLLVPFNSPELRGDGHNKSASASPFVIAIKTAGMKGLPSVVNAVILISAWSAGNSDLYASSRTLYALALAGQAPRFLKRCTKDGLPVWAVAVTALFGFLTYMNAGSATSMSIFNWLYNVSSITGLITWLVILISYLRMYYALQKQGISRHTFPYVAPFQPYASWFGVVFVSLVLFFNGFSVFLSGNWEVSKFVAAYICFPIFGSLWLGWKLIHRTKWVRLEDIDFATGRCEYEKHEDTVLHEAPKGFWQRLWDYVF